MKSFALLLPIVSVIAAAASSPLAQAQPMIFDLNGKVVAAPAGLARYGALQGYLSINNSVVLVYF